MSAPPSPTVLLLRDELVGFARSKVMLVLWLLLPALAVGGYFLITRNADLGKAFGSDTRLTATNFMTLIMSSLAGTIAALMVAVDIVSERQRKVYELFVIRPVRRDAILWAKFLAVFGCVTVASVTAILAGIAVDAIQGDAVGLTARDLRSLASLIGVIAMSAAVGVFFGVLARTILVAVLLILYVGQNLAIVPMIPIYLGGLPNQFWVIMVITVALIALLMWGAIAMFRKSEF